MADEENGAVEKTAGGTMKLLVISLVASVIMSGVVGAGVYLLVTGGQNAPAGENPDEQSIEKKPSGPPIYYEISDPFIVNLAEEPGRFLQVSVQMMAYEQEVIDAVERHMPVIRNNLLLLFSSQTLERINTREGKENLRQQAIEEVREVLDEQSEPAALENVLFTSLVVQ